MLLLFGFRHALYTMRTGVFTSVVTAVILGGLLLQGQTVFSQPPEAGVDVSVLVPAELLPYVTELNNAEDRDVNDAFSKRAGIFRNKPADLGARVHYEVNSGIKQAELRKYVIEFRLPRNVGRMDLFPNDTWRTDYALWMLSNDATKLDHVIDGRVFIPEPLIPRSPGEKLYPGWRKPTKDEVGFQLARLLVRELNGDFAAAAAPKLFKNRVTVVTNPQNGFRKAYFRTRRQEGSLVIELKNQLPFDVWLMVTLGKS